MITGNLIQLEPIKFCTQCPVTAALFRGPSSTSSRREILGIFGFVITRMSARDDQVTTERHNQLKAV